MSLSEPKSGTHSLEPSRVWIGIVVVNVAAGVSAAGLSWTVFTLAMLYWVEEAIAGLMAIVKLYRARRLGVLGSRTYKVLFFIAHYATYCVLHLAVLLAVLSPEMRAWTLDALWIVALVAFLVIHVWSYVQEYKGNDEFEIIPANVTLFSIYGRVAPAQMAVLLLIAVLPTQQEGVLAAITLLFIAIAKTVLDVLGHYWEHSVLPNKYRPGTADPS